MSRADLLLEAMRSSIVSDRPGGAFVADPGFALAYGDVTATSPVEVRIAGDTTSTEITERLASYTPTTNDRVILARVGPVWIILGDLN